MASEIICKGPEGLSDAAEILLHDDTIDILIVKGLTKNLEFLNMLPQQYDGEPVRLPLYTEVPSLNELDAVVAKYWDEHGYSDYELTDGSLWPSGISEGGMKAHTDFTGLNKDLTGPLSLSLGVTGSAFYEARKPGKQFKKPDGTWDYDNWKKWKKEPIQLPLRSSVIQEVGDGVFFVNHPQQTAHSISMTQNFRKAALFDYFVNKK